jgi:biotin-(acetyl-CoA carboxylase) ligase
LRGNKVFAIVAGVGVNLNQDVFPDNFETPATSMHLITEKLYNPQVEVEMLFGFVNRYYDLLQNGEHEKVRIAYNSYLFRKGEPSRFRDIDGYFEAVLEDVDDEGAAILIRNGRPVRALHPFVRFSLV